MWPWFRPMAAKRLRGGAAGETGAWARDGRALTQATAAVVPTEVLRNSRRPVPPLLPIRYSTSSGRPVATRPGRAGSSLLALHLFQRGGAPTRRRDGAPV